MGVKNFFKDNAGTFLAIGGSLLTVGVCIFCAKDTLKAKEKVEKAREEKIEETGEDLTDKEIIKVGYKCYWRTALLAGASIACTITSNGINRKRQAAILSAYVAMKASYSKYKDKVDEMFGEGSDHKIDAELAKDNIEERMERNPFDIVMDDGVKLYNISPCAYDNSFDQFVKCTESEFLRAMHEIIDSFHSGEVSVNDMYDIFSRYDSDVTPIDGGAAVGWGEHTIMDFDCENLHWSENEDHIYPDIIWVNFVEGADYFLPNDF